MGMIRGRHEPIDSYQLASMSRAGAMGMALIGIIWIIVTTRENALVLLPTKTKKNVNKIVGIRLDPC